MSILSDAISGKITFATAAAEAGAWVSRWVQGNPAAQAAAGAVLSDLKQAASNAVALADTALGPIIVGASLSIEASANLAMAKALGPVGVALTPAVDHAIETIANALKAEVDAAAAKLRADLSTKAASTNQADVSGGQPSPPIGG
jgi:hypothetical protein